MKEDCSDDLESAQNIPKLCPTCGGGVKYYYLNFVEKILLCEDMDCAYPLGRNDVAIIKNVPSIDQSDPVITNDETNNSEDDSIAHLTAALMRNEETSDSEDDSILQFKNDQSDPIIRNEETNNSEDDSILHFRVDQSDPVIKIEETNNSEDDSISNLADPVIRNEETNNSEDLKVKNVTKTYENKKKNLEKSINQIDELNSQLINEPKNSLTKVGYIQNLKMLQERSCKNLLHEEEVNNLETSVASFGNASTTRWQIDINIEPNVSKFQVEPLPND